MTYTIERLTMYKREPGVVYKKELQIISAGNSALCGIYMDIDQEYLIDLVRNDNGELETVGSCGAFQPWSEVTSPVMDLLQERCENYNTCENCTEFQVWTLARMYAMNRLGVGMGRLT